MHIHDSGYKILFSNRTIFRQLIETFVHEPWVKDLDFSQAETLKTTFIDEDYRQTASDLIYRLKLRDKEFYFYILMEFQSTVDQWMALRIANYVTNFYMSLAKARKVEGSKRGNGQTEDKKLPAVFPLLLYNGDQKWTAPTDLADLIENVPDLGQFGIRCQYLKIAENEFSKESLLKVRNIVSTLFLAETHYEIDLLIEELSQLFRTEEDRQAVSLFLNWFRQLAVHGYIESDDFGKVEAIYHSAEETQSMLITAIEKEKQEILEQGIEQGREEGIEQGIQATIKQLLEKRFGTIPSEVFTPLEKCSIEQLQSLVNMALDVSDMDEFITKLSQFGDVDADADDGVQKNDDIAE